MELLMKYGNYQPPKPQPPKKPRGIPVDPRVRDEARKRRNMDAFRNNSKTKFGYKVPKKKSPKILTTKKPKAR
jgi:hypothetical protein